MKPVWIKYYGIIPMTRRGYLIALASTGGFTLLLVLVVATLGLLPPLDTMWSRQHHRPGSGIDLLFYNYLYWIILFCLVAQTIDTCATLRIFAKKEAEQRAEYEREWGRSETAPGEGRRPPDERIRPG